MKAFSILIFVFFSEILLSQNLENKIKSHQVKVEINNEYFKDKIQFFDVNNIESITDKNIIRFWNTNNCIEITKTDHSIFGKVVFAIQDTDVNKQFLRKVIPLTEEQAIKILNVYEDLKINQIPAFEEIKGWTFGFDGNLYEIESLKEGKYKLKSYWTPEIQNIIEAKTILNLRNQINEIAEIPLLFEQFIANNKFICYKYFGTAYSVCKIQSRKETRKLSRKGKSKL